MRRGHQHRRDTSSLNQAVYNNDSYTLDQLLCQERYKRFINSRSGWGVPGTPLRLATSYGHLSCLQVLLAHGADVDNLDVKAQTPLYRCSHGHLDCVRVLLEAGACPGGSIYNNCSPVLTAARDGAVTILQELLRHGAEVNVQGKTTSLGIEHSFMFWPPLSWLQSMVTLIVSACFCSMGQTLTTTVTSTCWLESHGPAPSLEICLHHNCEPEYIRLLIDFGANIYLPSLSLDLNSQYDKGTALLVQAQCECQRPALIGLLAWMSQGHK